MSGIDEVHPAGTHTVETDEESLPGLSFPAYRRIAGLIFLRSRGGGGPVIRWSCKQLRNGMPACTPSPLMQISGAKRRPG